MRSMQAAKKRIRRAPNTTTPIGSGTCPRCGMRGQFQVKVNPHGYRYLVVFHSMVRNNHYTGYRYNCYIAMWKRVKQFITLGPRDTRHEIHLSAKEMTKCRVRKGRKQLLLSASPQPPGP